MEKSCTRCSETKSLNEFYKNCRGGFTSECRTCHIELYTKTNSYKTKAKEWREENKEKIKEYRKTNKRHINEAITKSKAKNPEKYRLMGINRQRRLMATCPEYVIGHRISRGVHRSLEWIGVSKARASWEKLVGYTRWDLKKHLESQFKEGMSWELLMQGKIHIDHIIPQSLFKFKSVDCEEFKKCWSLNNLQPLWARDNIIKSNNIIEPINQIS